MARMNIARRRWWWTACDWPEGGRGDRGGRSRARRPTRGAVEALERSSRREADSRGDERRRGGGDGSGRPSTSGGSRERPQARQPLDREDLRRHREGRSALDRHLPHPPRSPGRRARRDDVPDPRFKGEDGPGVERGVAPRLRPARPGHERTYRYAVERIVQDIGDRRWIRSTVLRPAGRPSSGRTRSGGCAGPCSPTRSVTG
jgi:hypothetical protein